MVCYLLHFTCYGYYTFSYINISISIIYSIDLEIFINWYLVKNKTLKLYGVKHDNYWA